MALEAIFENGDSLNSKRLLILDGIFLKWALSAIRCDRATPQRELPVNPAVFAHPRTGRTCPLCRENQSDLERASRASLIPCGIWTSAGLRGGHSVWSRDCHSIGVNVIANFEMPASVQVPTRGVTASEAPDQSSQTFGESLLEASKASPAAPMASTSGTTPTTQPEVTSADRLGPNPVLDSRASLPQASTVDSHASTSHDSVLDGHASPSHASTLDNHSSSTHTSTHQAVAPEQVSPAPLTDPTLASIQAPITASIPTQDTSTIATLQSSGDVRAQVASETVSSSEAAAQPAQIPAHQLQSSSSPFQTVLKSYLPDSQGMKAAASPQTQSGLDESQLVAGAASQTVQSPDQGAQPTETQIGQPVTTTKQTQDIAADAVSTASSIPAANALQGTAPVTGQIGLQNALPKDNADTSSNNIPSVPSNAVQGAASNAAPIPEQSSLSQQTPDVRGDASSTTITTQAPAAAQPATENAALTGVQDSLPKETPAAFTNAASAPASIPAANTDQRPATSAIPAEVQNVNPKEVLQATSGATSSSSSHVASDPIENALPEAVSGAVSSASQNPTPRGTEGMEFRAVVETTSNPVASTSSSLVSSAAQSALAQPAVSAPASADPNQAGESPKELSPNAVPEQQTISVASGKSMPDSGAVQDTGAPQDSSGPSSSVPINAPGALEDPAPKLAGQMSSLPIENVASRTAPNTVMSPAEQPAASASASAPSRPSTIAATEIAASEIAATETKPRPAPETDPLAPSVPIVGNSTKAVSTTAQSSATDAGPKAIPDSLPKADLNAASKAGVDSSSSAAAGSAVNSSLRAALDTAVNSYTRAASNLAADSNSSAAADTAANSPLRAALNTAVNSYSRAASDAAVAPSSSAAQSTAAGSSPKAASDAAVDSSSSAAPSIAANEAQNSTVKAVVDATSIPALKAIQDVLPSAPSDKASSTTAQPVANKSPVQVTAAFTKAVASPASDSIPNPVADAGPAPRSHVAPVPQAVEAGAAKKPVAATLSQASTAPSTSRQGAPDDGAAASTLGVPSSTADQLLTLAKSSGGLLASSLGVGAIQNPALGSGPSAAVSSNGKIGAKDAATDPMGLTQHAQSVPDQSAKQSNSQDSASSGDQGQGSFASQVQSAAPLQASLGNQSVVAAAHTQTGANASPAQVTPTLAGAPALASKLPSHTSAAPTALPQAVPVINTAKLVQSMGQSEMRVGMRSTEFGNISISTSSTRDMISAQISLDHGELAKTLAASLPEMQARLGSNQAMDVRIDTNGTGTMNGAGTSSGMSNGSADQSRGGRQQPGDSSSSRTGYGVQEQQFSSGRAAATTGDARINARLDITV